VASWYPAAVFDPTAAATHVYDAASSLSSAVIAPLDVLPFRRPPVVAPPPVGA
jgi:hypothetical protein